MAAQHLVGLGVDDELHQAAFQALGHGQLHRPEAAFEQHDLVALLAGLLFGEADRGQVGQAEHRGGDGVVIHRSIFLRLEQLPRHGHAFGQGDRRELHASDYVANGENRRH